MPRKARVEIEGGLYHVITRGNDRRDIFHSDEDFAKFISLLAVQKQKAPFFLYAWCLMTNHIHLLIERQTHAVGQIMQRVLTGYSQWYNRRYKHIGHVFQGRHKALLCDSDTYLTELVRYIHLNPVRAKMVSRPENYPYSSHREYLGQVPAEITDVDPVLRRMGHTREIAVGRYREYVNAGIAISYSADLDSPAEPPGVVSPEFVDEAIHRMGEVENSRSARARIEKPVRLDSLIETVESVFEISRSDFCGAAKNARAVTIKEVFILVASESGAPINNIAAAIGLDTSTTSRRRDNARLALATDSKLRYAKELVERRYRERGQELHA